MSSSKISTVQPGACRRFEGLPVPSWFKDAGCNALRSMDVAESDVVLVSYPKTGTTWLQKMVHSLLRMDDEGVLTTTPEGDVGFKNQCYMEALEHERPTEPHPIFGDYCYPDLLNQPTPRIFSTHLRSTWLPRGLTGDPAKGKVVYMVRNPKDALVSLHYFRGEAKDGWLGNEHGAGSFARFIDPDTNNAFGNYYTHVADMEKYMGSLPPERGHVMVYEECLEDTEKEIRRLASFLGVVLTDTKLKAILDRVSFKTMSSNGGVNSILTRKGEAGDWRNYLDEDKWKQMDDIFNQQLGNGSKIGERLRRFM